MDVPRAAFRKVSSWLLAYLVAVACKEPEPRPVPPDPFCADGTVRCGNRCVAPEERPDAGCADVCSDCDAGADVCEAPLEQCGDLCLDLRTDPTSCGACGQPCGETQLCDGTGECAAVCSEGFEHCGTRCVDLETNVEHCGECGKTCGPSGSCEAGACTCADFHLESSVPARHALDAAADADVLLGFSCPADPTSIDGNAWAEGSLSGSHVLRIAELPPSLDVLSPETPFFPGERVRISLGSGLESIQGRNLDSAVLDFFVRTSEAPARFQRDQDLGQGAGFLALGDLTGDSEPDLVIASGDDTEARVLVSNLGQFTDTEQRFGFPTPGRVQLFDVDRDGDTDIVQVIIALGVEVWLNDGQGRFTESPHGFYLDDVSDVEIADFDVDGWLDFFTIGTSGPSRVMFGTPNEGWVDSGQELQVGSSIAVASADLNRDGLIDVLAVSQDGPSYVWQCARNRIFSRIEPGLDLAHVTDVALADFDGDGDADALTAGAPSELWRNDGLAELRPNDQELPAATLLAIADLDGDARLDAWLSHRDGDTLLFGAGSASFRPSDARVATLSSALGDVDGDGRVDAVGITVDDVTEVRINR